LPAEVIADPDGHQRQQSQQEGGFESIHVYVDAQFWPWILPLEKWAISAVLNLIIKDLLRCFS
jgi:hypothetical protein